MKKLITLCFAAFAFGNVQAQVENFKITPDSLVINGSAMDDGLKIDIEVKNTGTKTRTYTWQRIEVVLPTDWETSICDPVTCWSPLKDESDFSLAGGNGVGGMVLDAFPYEKPGSAYVKLKFFDKDLPNAISYGRYRLNALPVSVEEVEAAKLRIFPNPTADYFVLDGNAPLTSVQILSMTGQVLKTFPYVQNEIYEIDDLAAGMYLLNLNGENNKRLNTKRLIKR